MKIKKINMVIDFDEVLCDISPLWVLKLYKEKEFFSKYLDFNLIGLDNLDEINNDDSDLIEKVLSRPKFYIDEWLAKENVELDEEFKKRFFSVYDNENFYKDCYPTKMCNSLKLFRKQKSCGKIYVVSRCTENNINSKKEFLDYHFGENVVEFLPIKIDQKKSDVINDIKDDIHVYMDDELKNIQDILDNVIANQDSEKVGTVDIFVPLTGYNIPDHDLYEKVDKMKVALNYYPVLKSTEQELEQTSTI